MLRERRSSGPPSPPPNKLGRESVKQRLIDEFTMAAYKNLFDQSEPNAWRAVSDLEEHAQVVMEMSAKRANYVNLNQDRDDVFLSNHRVNACATAAMTRLKASARWPAYGSVDHGTHCVHVLCDRRMSCVPT